MSEHGKRYRKLRETVNSRTLYPFEEAVKMIKANATAKFDETAEIAIHLGIDPKKSEQMVRGTVSLPHGSGKKVRIVVFATGAAAEAAKAAGADHVGMEDLIAKVQGGWTDFDVAIATTEAMREVRKLGKVLGPRGLMPNPKTGSVTDDTAAAVGQFKAGRVEFKMDRNANVMVPFGKLSFSEQALLENGLAVLEAITAARPATAKGIFIRRCTLSSTMGPGVHVRVVREGA